MPTLTGRITSWDAQRGFGYVEADGQSHFLHHRDFAERHKAPAVDDVVNFSLGTDRKGRSCAVNARHQNDGGRLGGVHVVFLLLLLIAPTLAAVRLGQREEVWFVLVWYVLISALTWVLYYDDKRRARINAWRAPEKPFHLFELAGGWPGAFLAQRQLRHKVSKLGFQVVFWLIVTLHQFVAIDFLLGWRMIRALNVMISSR